MIENFLGIAITILWIVLALALLGGLVWGLMEMMDGIEKDVKAQEKRQEEIQQYVNWALQYGNDEERAFAIAYQQRQRHAQALGGLILWDIFMN